MGNLAAVNIAAVPKAGAGTDGDKLSEYFNARDHIYAVITRLIRYSGITGVGVLIDGDRSSLWEGLHDITFRTPELSHTVLMEHHRFLDPAFIDTQGVPVFLDALGLVTRPPKP